jgi:hypothetical protein
VNVAGDSTVNVPPHRVGGGDEQSTVAGDGGDDPDVEGSGLLFSADV